MSKPQLTNPTNEQELREQITPLVIEAIKDDLDTWHFMHSVITTHANAEIAKVLDRLESTAVYAEYDKAEDDVICGDVVPLDAIQAERNKLKEVK